MRLTHMERRVGRDDKPVLIAVAALVLLTCFALSGRASGQAKPAAQPLSAKSSGQTSLTRQLVKETREAAGEDDSGQFKHSESVRLVARLTGLNLEHAYWLCLLFNFAVVAVVIIWLSKTRLPALFRARTASIQKAMEEARKASAEANQRMAGIEARLTRLDSEIAEMRAAAEKEAADEERRIQAAAAEDARKVVEAAEQEIAAAAKAARRELTAYAADLAVSLATKQIRVDAATDEALVRNFAQGLAGNGGSRKGA